MKAETKRKIAMCIAMAVVASNIPAQTFASITKDSDLKHITYSTYNEIEETVVPEKENSPALNLMGETVTTGVGSSNPTTVATTTLEGMGGETSTVETTGQQTTAGEPTTGETTGETTTQEVTTQQSTTQQETTTQPTTTTQQATTTQQETTTQLTTTTPETTTAKKTAWGEYNGSYYNDKLVTIPNAVKKGIDVSHHQSAINWKKVSSTDVDFAIIRCGYGDNITSQDDKYFYENIKGCEDNNIPYGIYIYSYAQNKKQAKSEARHVLRLLQSSGANPQYPIYIDFEDSSQNNLTAKQLGDIAQTFFNITIKAGYKAGVYANLNWWTNKLTDKRFNQWTKWVAQYNSSCAYQERYEVWQATSDGKVSGISGRTDLNFLLKRSCEADGHIWSQWVKLKQATVLSKGTSMRICSDCGEIQKKSIAKLKATGKLNFNSVKLRVRGKFKIKVRNLALGDKVKSYKSSNKKIVTVSKKGKITAKKKKGKATVTVKLLSGKKLKVKVKVVR